MNDIKINETIWNMLSMEDKQIIHSYLKESGVLQPGQNVIGDVYTYPPKILIEEDADENYAKLIDWICKSICTSTGASDRCTLHNKSTQVCLASIRQYREKHSPQGSPANISAIRHMHKLTIH